MSNSYQVWTQTINELTKQSPLGTAGRTTSQGQEGGREAKFSQRCDASLQGSHFSLVTAEKKYIRT